MKKTIFLGILFLAFVPQIARAEKTGREESPENIINSNEIDPTKQINIQFADGKVIIPPWNGRGEKGAVFAVTLDGVPSAHWSIYFRRFDPEGADFDSFLGESKGARHPVVVKFILQKRDEDGRIENEFVLGQWTHLTAEAVDIERKKIIHFVPYMHSSVADISKGELTDFLLRDQIAAHLKNKKSISLIFMPRFFEFAHLPAKLQLYPGVEALIANLSKGNTEYADQIRNDVLKQRGPAPRFQSIEEFLSIRRRCSRLISNLLSYL